MCSLVEVNFYYTTRSCNPEDSRFVPIAMTNSNTTWLNVIGSYWYSCLDAGEWTRRPAGSKVSEHPFMDMRCCQQYACGQQAVCEMVCTVQYPQHYHDYKLNAQRCRYIGFSLWARAFLAWGKVIFGHCVMYMVPDLISGASNWNSKRFSVTSVKNCLAEQTE
jgi:hypothetical protein